VSAAAAVILSLHPTLDAEQVTELLEHTTDDMDPKTGCLSCTVGRDAASGWGALDVASAISALAGRLPWRDHFEANDDAGRHAHALVGQDLRIHATADFWDDQDDVYSIRLHRGQHVYVGLMGYDPGVDLDLALWLPQTRSIYDVREARFRVRVSARPGERQYFAYRAPRTARYFVQVRISTPGSARYRLSIVKS
jgi:hypothetical protein